MVCERKRGIDKEIKIKKDRYIQKESEGREKDRCIYLERKRNEER